MKKSLLIFAALLGFAVANAQTTPPEGATVEYYNCTGYSYGLYEDMEWQSEVAIVGNSMYVKNIFALIDDPQWVVGTIDGNTVTFVKGQHLGGMDQTKYGGEFVFTDGTLAGMNQDFEETDAHLKWNADTKTLVAVDYEIGAYTAQYGGFYDLYDGVSDPDATHTMVGSGQTYVFHGPEPTGVTDVKATTSKAVKMIENGRVVIEKDGVKYNVMGQKL